MANYVEQFYEYRLKNYRVEKQSRFDIVGKYQQKNIKVEISVEKDCVKSLNGNKVMSKLHSVFHLLKVIEF